MTDHVDFAKQRHRFPTLADRAYLAAHCLGPYPAELLDELRAYERNLVLRKRGIPEWSERWPEMHRLTERLLGAPIGSVFLRDSATAAHSAVAASIEPERERNRILIGSADFHSLRYMWHAQTRRGYEVVEIEAAAGLHADPETFIRAIDERVRIVALSLVSPQSGAMLAARTIAEAARRAGAIVFLDTYQAVGVVPVQVEHLAAHVVVGGYHKWLGGTVGLAFGYVEPSLTASLDPMYPGWMGHREFLGFQHDYRPSLGAERFQQGMAAMESVYCSSAGVRWTLEVGIESIRERSLVLTERLLARAREHGLAVTTPPEPERRGGMVCITHPRSAAVVEALEARGMDIDSRPNAGLRIGPHPCVTEAECDAVIDAIASFPR